MAPRIQPVDDAQVPEAIRQYFRIAEERGAPNSTLLRILAREPRSLHIFYDAWIESFYEGQVDHFLKELVRVRMARLRGCGY